MTFSARSSNGIFSVKKIEPKFFFLSLRQKKTKENELVRRDFLSALRSATENNRRNVSTENRWLKTPRKTKLRKTERIFLGIFYLFNDRRAAHHRSVENSGRLLFRSKEKKSSFFSFETIFYFSRERRHVEFAIRFVVFD